MTESFVSRAAPLLSIFAALGCAPEPTVPGAELAITGVSVVPMDAQGVLEGHTVVIADAQIAVVAPVAEVVLDPETRIASRRA